MKRIEISKEKLERMYRYEALTQAEIAEKLGCSPMTISVRLRKYGISTEWGWRSIYLDEKKLKRLYVRKKMTLLQVAMEMDATIPLVKYNLKILGIPRRRGS